MQNMVVRGRTWIVTHVYMQVCFPDTCIVIVGMLTQHILWGLI